MNSMINFPLYDFDFSPYVNFVDPNTCHLYDLFGIVVSFLDEILIHLAGLICFLFIESFWHDDWRPLHCEREE